jgi:7,8-dihydro-6-hydroxymethylpterin dimethyltransferase
MSRKVRPYLFYNTTSSVCSTCLRLVEAKIIIKEDKVFMDKWCRTHGTERVLISDDVQYYRRCREVYIKPPEMPAQFNTPMKYGCPYDCGLCPDHMQHSCLSIVELTDHCNLRCPVCYAASGPERLTHRSLEQVVAMLDAVVANEGEPDVVQLSGGEPTLHPQFWDILEAARVRPIKHLMINTNGIRIAQENGFAQRLASYGQGIEIYLQFDSLKASVLHTLRGADLTRIRSQALEKLNACKLSTTLVMTVQRGLNDQEIGSVIQHALTQPCVRGVTLQPIQQAGRVSSLDAPLNRLTVSEIRRCIAQQSDLFSLDDVVPVPCNPDTLAMAYAIKVPFEDDAGNVQTAAQPLTRFIAPEVLLAGQDNTIVFERDVNLKNKLFELFSTNHSPDSQANCLSELMCCLPQIDAPALNYENVFRVLIVQFMDATNLDIRALKKSCIHIAQPDGKMIPFESFNLFYRDGQKKLLQEVRHEIIAPRHGTLAPI